MRPSLLAVFALACAPLPLDAPQPYAWVVYDPGAGEIPLPNDAARDAETGLLALPTDDPDLTATEVAVREALNELDGWGSTTPIAATFSEPVAPSSVTSDSVQVWEWGASPARVEVATVELDEAGLEVTVTPPREGWARGGRYVVAIRGGDRGVRAVSGLPVGPDAAMTYLRSIDPLTEHPRAFPGATRAERAQAAADLEAIRVELAPHLDVLEARGLPRDELAAAWKFTVTTRAEIAMDEPSQRMPLPFDLLIDPDTGLVSLEPAAWDDALEVDAKLQASTLAGFGTSASPWFELTGPIDVSTLGAVRLYDIDQTPQEIPVETTLLSNEGETCDASPAPASCRFVMLRLPHEAIPLGPGRTYAVVVEHGLADEDGRPVAPMPIGALLRGAEPISVDGTSRVASLDDATAARLEDVRARLDVLLDQLGRDDLVTAWPFTTLDAAPALRVDAARAEVLDVPVTPRITSRLPAYSLIWDDALSSLFPGILNPGPAVYRGRVQGVAEVVEGTIPTPYFLDPITRRWTDTPATRELPFLATVPERVDRARPVVIFGHPITTDRRFLLMISGALAKAGFVAIAIDFPFHGERTACIDASLVAVPNFLPPSLRPPGFEDDLLYLPPCASGAASTCAPTGECVGPDGKIEDFSHFPVLDVLPASGAAFLDVHDLPHIPDHFRQAIVDLGALKHSLQTYDWEAELGVPLRTDKVHYVGQSLGAILGAVWVAVEPDVDRAVLNVPGANMVELFRDSVYFAPQMDDYLRSLEVDAGSWREARLLHVAHWLIDPVDPHSVAHLYAEDDRPVLLQIDRINEDLGDLIIPNHTTDTLQRASGREMIEYPSVLHGDLVIPGLGDAMLADLVDWLEAR